MAVTEDHASCWAHKDLTVTTKHDKTNSGIVVGSQKSHCDDKTNSGVVDSSEGVGRKGRMSSTTDRYRAGILDGRRDRQIRGLQLPRQSQRVMDPTKKGRKWEQVI